MKLHKSLLLKDWNSMTVSIAKPLNKSQAMPCYLESAFLSKCKIKNTTIENQIKRGHSQF